LINGILTGYLAVVASAFLRAFLGFFTAKTTFPEKERALTLLARAAKWQ
jgi:hypothetical protein